MLYQSVISLFRFNACPVSYLPENALELLCRTESDLCMSCYAHVGQQQAMSGGEKANLAAERYTVAL